MKNVFIWLFSFISCAIHSQTITVTVTANQGLTPISPWIYGKNNNVSDDPAKPTSAATWAKYNDAGLRMYRENGGNNATKYNWRKKITSHPDWYNNVYSADWDFSATSLLNNTTNTQGLYAFQLLGKAASNKNNNFNDWAYNQSAGGPTTVNNWAGGGNPNSGDPNLYLEDWPADSTTGILKYWFETLQSDSTRLRYWNMDNEPEIWKNTHDDIASTAITAEDFVQKYITVAKLARKNFPWIKLVGPVSPDEWQFYTWNDAKVKDLKDGNMYPWMEYFIKRIGEEQIASGIKLLDVLDVHFYPATQSNPDLTLQIHRFWYDTQWDYPGANGVKVTSPASWDNTITKEYFFERCNQWLVKYLGANHNVKFGVSEYGTIANSGAEDPNIIACWYASHLGTFANKGVELFTPWDWYKGQWEVLHLFSKYYGTMATQAVSTAEATVSGYSSLSKNGDSLMVVLVNKDRNNAENVDVNIQGFVPSSTTVNGYQLANLPTTETFVSSASNALQSKQYTISGNTITLSVPKLSVTLIQVPTNQPVSTGIPATELKEMVKIFPNPTSNKLTIKLENNSGVIVILHDLLGREAGSWRLDVNGQIDISHLNRGAYILQVLLKDKIITRKIMKE